MRAEVEAYKYGTGRRPEIYKHYLAWKHWGKLTDPPDDVAWLLEVLDFLKAEEDGSG